MPESNPPESNLQCAIRSPQSAIRNPQSQCLFACLYHPATPAGALVAIAEQFSPRYERYRDDLIAIDVSGLERLLGPARAIGGELRREGLARGIRPHVALAATRTAALLAAHGCPGLTVVERGREAETLAPLPIALLEKIPDEQPAADRDGDRERPAAPGAALAAVRHWGLNTLGELAALPAADLVSRLGRQALAWQAMARGEDLRPLVPTLAAERFDSSLDLEWPIEGLEPLSFVLTRLLEPLSVRLERRDRGAAVLHVRLRLVTRDEHARRLELPSPMRDVRTLRTLALLDLESHPPAAAIDGVTIVIDPTPGRVLQHTLFTRARPTPEQLSTLLARLGALMGQDRFGAPAVVDTFRPGAFAMREYQKTEVGSQKSEERRVERTSSDFGLQTSDFSLPTSDCSIVVSALRRCRHPVPARVAVAAGRPVRVTTDRRGFAGGTVMQCAGPWRTSGDWWATGQSGKAGEAGTAGSEMPQRSVPPIQPLPPIPPPWNRDEWDVALNDGAAYRIFQDRATEAWFIDGIVD